MPNPGVPWQDVLAEAAERGCADGRQLAEACLDVVAELPAAERPMLTAVLPPRLVEVGPCVTRLVTTATGSMAQAAPAITLAASESRACGGPQMCDAARFAARLAECADDATVRQAASEVALALKRSEVRPGIAGPTLLVPGPLGEIPAGYRQAATGIATECGWAELVEAYTSRLRDLMQPAALGGAAAPKGGV